MSSILAQIKTLPVSDRSREMVNFIGSNKKLARTLGRINFLVDCRSLKIMPSFISNKTRKLNETHHNQRITTQVDRLQKTMLNEEIRYAFRMKAYIQRSMTRSAQIIGEKTPEWFWIYEEGEKIFIQELTAVKERLSKKLTELCMRFDRHDFDLTRSQVHKIGRSFGLVEAKVGSPDKSVGTGEMGEMIKTQESLLEHSDADQSSPHFWSTIRETFRYVIFKIYSYIFYIFTCFFKSERLLPHPVVTTETSYHDQGMPQRDDLENRKHQDNSTDPRLTNLSSYPLKDSIVSLLGRGPKYALTNRVTPSLLHSVEVGIERAFYGLKWRTTIEARKTRNDLNTSPTEDEENDGEEEHSEDADTPASATMPRPYFPDTTASQPPTVSVELERSLEKVKSKILGIYQGCKRNDTLNSTAAQRKDLEELRKDSRVIIKRSDKCKSLVVMDRGDYIEKAESVINKYESVDKNPTPKVEEETKSLIKTTLKNKVPDDVIQRLLPQHTRTAEFYGLPKTHKPGNPLRPIVSACGDPLDKLSWLLQCILTQLLSFIPAHLSNTADYLTRMKNAFPTGLPPGSIIFSLDVSNLYGSIPIKEGIDSVMLLVERNVTKVNMFGITPPDLRTLLTHVLTNNFVRFGSRFLKQTSGIAMGSRVAPPVAITFMHILETSFMTTLQFTPALYLRYIDDILGIWTHGIDRLNHYFNCINAYNPSISFTMDSTFQTGQLPFLDTLITLHPSGTYTTELYFKPMTAPIILHFSSAHPMSTKRAVLSAEIKRAIRVSSGKETRERSIHYVKSLFQQNGYPDTLLDKLIRNNLRDTYRTRSPRNRQTEKEMVTYMRLPYINERVARRVTGVLKRSGTTIKVAWTSGPTIGGKLITSALTSPTCPAGTRHCHTCVNGLQGKCTKKNVVYKITCKLCGTQTPTQFYIGESTRPVRYRFNEHLSDARLRKSDTPLGEHIIAFHYNASNTKINTGFKIEILCSGRDCAEIKIAESIHIRNHKPPLNIMRSSWPLVR